MFTNILDDFEDKEVQITLSSGKTFSGILKHQTSQNAVVISPVSQYDIKNYGPAFIKESEIASVREVLPYIDDDDKDCEDQDCCDSSSI